MEIKIIRNSNNILLDQNKALWNVIQTNKPLISTLFPILSLVLGTIFILLCFASFRMGENFWGLQSVFGIILIILSVFFYSKNHHQKKLFFEETKHIIEEYEKNKNVTEIILTDAIIKIKDFQSYHEIEWTAFKHIKKTKDHFFFMTNKNYQNGFAITKNELKEYELQEITNFIQKLKQF